MSVLYGVVEGSGGERSWTEPQERDGGGRGGGGAGDAAGAPRALAQCLRHILHHVPDVFGVQHRAHWRLALPRQGNLHLPAGKQTLQTL